MGSAGPLLVAGVGAIGAAAAPRRRPRRFRLAPAGAAALGNGCGSGAGAPVCFLALRLVAGPPDAVLAAVPPLALAISTTLSKASFRARRLRALWRSVTRPCAKP